MSRVTVVRKSWSHVSLNSNSDRVVAAMPIPQDGVLLGYRVVSHAVCMGTISVSKAAMVGMSSYIVGVGEDPGAGTNVDDLFDQQVPKDLNVIGNPGELSIDLDDATDTDPFDEPGLANINDIFQISSSATKLRGGNVMMSVASHGTFHLDQNPTQDAATWLPNAVMNMRGGSVRVDRPSYLLVAATSPSMDEMTTTVPVIITPAKWAMLQYMDYTLRGMFPQVVGLTDSGAVGPFNDYAQFIEELVEPRIYEETTGNFAGVGYQVFTEYEVRVSVPGEPSVGVIQG